MTRELQELIRLALAEDLGPGDVTSAAVIAPDARACGEILAKEQGVISGLSVAAAVFAALDADISFESIIGDGERSEAGTILAKVVGNARALLSGERVALNFLQRLSGIATLTAQFAECIEGTGVRLLDTRKTTPGWRAIEKAAVAHGGGTNHRLGLYDAVMIKDNHIAAAGGIAAVLAALQRAAPAGLPVVVEVRDLAQIREAARDPVDRLMLDNFSVAQVGRALEELRGIDAVLGRHIEVEISGGITRATIAAYAQPGVDFISVGALTHSAPALDIAMNIVWDVP